MKILRLAAVLALSVTALLANPSNCPTTSLTASSLDSLNIATPSGCTELDNIFSNFVV